IVFLLLFYNFFIVISVRYGALLALGGRSSPDLQCSGGLSPGTFCEEFACSPRVHKGFPPIRTPTGKTCKNRTFSCPSVTETDGSLGPRALRSCPLLLEGLGGRMVRDRSNAERIFHSDLRPARVCVCVSCVASIKYTCVLQCAACGNKRTDFDFDFDMLCVDVFFFFIEYCYKKETRIFTVHTVRPN